MADIANTKDIEIRNNVGKVGADNSIDVEGGVGKNVALSNVTDVKVAGLNRGAIGADNTYDLKGGIGDGASVGNTSEVRVGQNLGSIGSGNMVNFK